MLGGIGRVEKKERKTCLLNLRMSQHKIISQSNECQAFGVKLENLVIVLKKSGEIS